MKENIYYLVSKNFKYIRTTILNMTQEKLAEEINMSCSHISHIESIKIKSGISLDTLFYISQKYNIDIRSFFEGYEVFINEK